MKYYLTTSNKLSSIPVVTGNVIFVKDIRTLFMDDPDGRKSYTSITILDTEHERSTMPAPVNNCFYFVKETACLWTYENAWIQVTEPPSEEIVWLPRSEFPIIGKEKTLYMSGKDIYVWLNGQYEQCNSGGAVSEIEWKEV